MMPSTARLGIVAWFDGAERFAIAGVHQSVRSVTAGLGRRSGSTTACSARRTRRVPASRSRFTMLRTVASSAVTMVTPEPTSTASPRARMKSRRSPSRVTQITPERQAMRVPAAGLTRSDYCKPSVIMVRSPGRMMR